MAVEEEIRSLHGDWSLKILLSQGATDIFCWSCIDMHIQCTCYIHIDVCTKKRSNYIIWKIQLELQLFRVYYLCEFMILQYFSEGENHGQTGTFRPPKSASDSVSTVKAAGKQWMIMAEIRLTTWDV